MSFCKQTCNSFGCVREFGGEMQLVGDFCNDFRITLPNDKRKFLRNMLNMFGKRIITIYDSAKVTFHAKVCFDVIACTKFYLVQLFDPCSSNHRGHRMVIFSDVGLKTYKVRNIEVS